MEIRTNNVPRDILYGYELSEKERAEFDYLDDEDLDCANFIRYRGFVYSLDDFMHWDNPESPTRGEWDAIYSDSFFSGIAIKLVDNCERVIVATVYS